MTLNPKPKTQNPTKEELTFVRQETLDRLLLSGECSFQPSEQIFILKMDSGLQSKCWFMVSGFASILSRPSC